MALIKCKECGHEVSNKAKSCPNCGADAPKKTSVVTWIIALLLGWFVYSTISSYNEYEQRAQKVASHPGSTSTTETAAGNDVPPDSSPPPATKPKSAWNYSLNTDQMTGQSEGFIHTTSITSHRGWLSQGKILLGYHCKGAAKGFYLRANDLGFQIDDIDCGSYSCKREQYGRVKFDDNQPVDIVFNVWDDNNDGMTVAPRHWQNDRDNNAFLINSMKAGTKAIFEIELFNTKGKQQLVEFSLTGFSTSLAKCRG